jgi:hypothetical protein
VVTAAVGNDELALSTESRAPYRSSAGRDMRDSTRDAYTKNDSFLSWRATKRRRPRMDKRHMSGQLQVARRAF